MSSLLDRVSDHDDFTGGHLKALVIELGGVEAAKRVLRGEQTIQLVDAEKKLFTRRGIHLHGASVNGLIRDPEYGKFIRLFPSDGYENIFLKTFPEFESKMHPTIFKHRVLALESQLKSNPRLKNVCEGPYIGVALPRFTPDVITPLTYTRFVNEEVVTIVSKFYPNGITKKFGYFEEFELVAQGGQMMLLSRLQQGPLVGLYFLEAFHGYQHEAIWQELQKENLPTGFALPGAIETLMLLCSQPQSLEYRSPLPVTGVQLHGGYHTVEYASRRGCLEMNFSTGTAFRSNPSSGLFYYGAE